ncbi:MAG: AtpZ/AtpI family protein [Acidobacteriota bacterium]
MKADVSKPVAGAYGSDSIPGAETGPLLRDVSRISGIIFQAGPYMGAASVMTGAVLGGGFGGRWLDERLATSPLFLMLGLLGGAAVGMYEIVRVATRRGPDRR